MLRLTLRSAKDGRFLARVVDPGGYPFVLDFGDRRVISDISQRLLHGFTMWRWGKLVNVTPSDPDVMNLLAEYYASEGVLVFLEEPGWSGHPHSLEDRLDGPPGAPVAPVFLADAEGSLNLSQDDLPTEDAEFDDPSTEIVSIEEAGTDVVSLSDLPDVGDWLEPSTDTTETVGSEDLETEVIDLAEVRKKRGG